MVGHSSVPGHVEYSRLLQDCFFDLNDVFVCHKAEVYRYHQQKEIHQ